MREPVTRLKRRVSILLAVLAFAVVSLSLWSSSSTAAGGGAATRAATPAQQVQQARTATQRFKSVAVARRSGYRQATPCIPEKGIHFRSMKAYNEPGVYPTRPEMLLYEPTAKGLVLVGVEYELADGDQRYETAGDRPKLIGVKFDGPLDPHPTGPQKIHYHLHVWLWKANPRGLVTEFHPRVSCR